MGRSVYRNTTLGLFVYAVAQGGGNIKWYIGSNLGSTTNFTYDTSTLNGQNNQFACPSEVGNFWNSTAGTTPTVTAGACAAPACPAAFRFVLASGRPFNQTVGGVAINYPAPNGCTIAVTEIGSTGITIPRAVGPLPTINATTGAVIAKVIITNIFAGTVASFDTVLPVDSATITYELTYS
jgi:hypothetical protein